MPNRDEVCGALHELEFYAALVRQWKPMAEQEPLVRSYAIQGSG